MKIDLKFYQKNTLNLLLLGNSALCVALLFFRLYATGEPHFFFLAWNLILAWIPFLLSKMITKSNRKARSFRTVLLFFLWLIFFPNALYIITDLFHFHQRTMVPLWFDLVLILSFAWNGLMLGFISLMEIQKFLSKKFGSQTGFRVAMILLIISAFGIYLGRYLRWNSWDLFTNLSQLYLDVADRFMHPMKHPRTIGVTILFALFLTMSYTTFFYLVNNKQEKNELEGDH